ncbi:MAG: carbamate kinase [Candidatus Izemoplasmataceae bacterium]|jgi:carbamate kinase|uniref:carbamate kinase n=1 Tax=Liberiplasma polymorphum TaxID=3374570 RepID=UPI003772F4E0
MKIVIALGGNALGDTPEEQLKLVKETALPLVDLIEEGHQLIIAHGNGPQVGMINKAMESANQYANTPLMPFPECGAMSQGYIGYHLQNAIREELNKRNVKKEVVSLVTQVVVDENDPGFKNPSKPIGAFYSKEEAETLTKTKNYVMVEDSGRGYRRVVPSPKPVDVVEKNIVQTLSDQGVIVITVGGGGIPVIKKDHGYEGVAAVIDKDFASAKVAELLNADYLFILTAIDRVMINFNQPNQKALESMTVKEAMQYIEEGHFAPGSMLPKVEAAISFVENNPGRTSVIASLDKAKDAILGKTGTKIVQ